MLYAMIAVSRFDDIVQVSYGNFESDEEAYENLEHNLTQEVLLRGEDEIKQVISKLQECLNKNTQKF